MATVTTRPFAVFFGQHAGGKVHLGYKPPTKYITIGIRICGHRQGLYGYYSSWNRHTQDPRFNLENASAIVVLNMVFLAATGFASTGLDD